MSWDRGQETATRESGHGGENSYWLKATRQARLYEMTSTWRCVAIIFVCMTLQNSHAALDMGARVLPGGRGCSLKVWAPHGENVRVEVRKRDEGAGIAQETVELKQVRSSVDVQGSAGSLHVVSP